MQIFRLPVQPTRTLHVRRSGDAWLVWLAGSPETANHTYIVLYDTGRIQRVTEGPDTLHVLDVQTGE
jgi:hypothetical protein